MADLHPEVEALIAKGPQEVEEGDYDDEGRGWYAPRMETESEFRRRIALLAASKAREEERESWANECQEMASNQCIVKGAIIAGEGGHFYCSRNDRAEKYEWLLHSANKEEIEATLLSGRPWHQIELLIAEAMANARR